MWISQEIKPATVAWFLCLRWTLTEAAGLHLPDFMHYFTKSSVNLCVTVTLRSVFFFLWSRQDRPCHPHTSVRLGFPTPSYQFLVCPSSDHCCHYCWLGAHHKALHSQRQSNLTAFLKVTRVFMPVHFSHIRHSQLLTTGIKFSFTHIRKNENKEEKRTNKKHKPYLSCLFK